MITVKLANEKHVEGIVEVCTKANWATYGEIYTEAYIKRIIDEFYTNERVKKEVTHFSEEWGGYFVALENGEVIGAGGGGLIEPETAEVYVLYLHPDRRGEGVGTRLLEEITRQQRDAGAKEQWVSVQKGNEKGIPFYKARGFSFIEEVPGYGNSEAETYRSIRLRRKL
ncbi:GNAT family N-acetyltransferase [Thalassobacillus hwangdonensis]|uniref:GNAT family N-acetyltransferase n=1 Tax=Thalassobacillus hwangdonensis TaxID=546108 RepID=A0ABW3L234_9BACI